MEVGLIILLTAVLFLFFSLTILRV